MFVQIIELSNQLPKIYKSYIQNLNSDDVNSTLTLNKKFIDDWDELIYQLDDVDEDDFKTTLNEFKSSFKSLFNDDYLSLLSNL